MESLAILVAAGQGQRMGAGSPKAFLSLAGQPLLLWSARAFVEAPSVSGIVAVVPDGHVARARTLLEPTRALRGAVAGGPRRQDSVQAGLAALPEGFDGLVLVHDAARPLLEVDLIERVVAAAAETGAALPVLEVVDTVKRVEAGRVVETLDRTTLARAQTPQAFHYPLLVRAYAEAARAGLSLTDEAMAVEHLGAPVVAVLGSERNRKFTRPEDLEWAEALLARERQGASR
jgi:2-C-methyl-D-erythritol 4-phosphate cytidylyltransferase